MKLSKKRLLDRQVCITVSQRLRHNSAKVKNKRYQKPTFAVADLDFHDDGGGGGILLISHKNPCFIEYFEKRI